ncbi:MAG: GNAT family N-acetyltransferase [Caldilineaceae bacterium]|nr:GNAT family N-acetyltransferase [Caldilineaceae bacterium]
MKLDRILDYLHARARQQCEVIGVAPFTLYLHLTSPIGENNVALPDAAFQDDISAILPQIDAFFSHRGRTPRIQFLDRQYPALEDSLTAAGYMLDEKLPVLVCTPEDLHMPTHMPPITVTAVDAESSDELVAEGWLLNNEGFTGRVAVATADDVSFYRRVLGKGSAFSAYLDGVAAGAGMFHEPLVGVTEIAGITTLPAFRGKGIASAVTAHVTAAAFGAGVSLAYLVAASPEASRIYLRLGYEFCGHLVTMINPNPGKDADA